MTPEEYEQKRHDKYDRLSEAAEKARQRSAAENKKSDDMASHIPFGQPILVGHYSEGRDRRYREKIGKHMDNAISESKKADYYERRAAAVLNNKAIFSDDPNALEKIADKVARLEKVQEMMKAANKLVRKNDREGLLDLGFSPKKVEALFTPDFAGRPGFPDYAITNNAANIRRLKKRTEVLEERQEEEVSEKTINGVRIVNNVDDNRLQMFFKGKPADEIRLILKNRGFRWSPTNGCWQAYINNSSKYHADKIAEQIKEQA